MKTHTAQHLFSAIAYSRFGASSVDMAIEPLACTLKFDMALTIGQILQLQEEANACIESGLPVGKNMEGGTIWIEIDSIDRRMCGCTHVKSLKEIGSICVTAVEGMKIVFKVGHHASAALCTQQKDALTINGALPKHLNTPSEFVDAYTAILASGKLMFDQIGKLSSELLEYQLLYDKEEAIALLGCIVNVIARPELDIRQLRPVVQKYLETYTEVIVVICKNNTVLVFSSVDALPADTVMGIFKNAASGCKGGGTKLFAQGGPWMFDLEQTREVLRVAGLEVTAYCD